MNQEEMGIKVHGSLCITALSLCESYTLTHSALSELGHSFTTLRTHPVDLGATLSTLHVHPANEKEGTRSRESLWESRCHGDQLLVQQRWVGRGEGAGKGGIAPLTWCDAGVLWPMHCTQQCVYRVWYQEEAGVKEALNQYPGN